MSNTAHDLTKRLLNALDSHYNVIDMHAITEIISILEKITITKELLEATRLGKHVNELRRRAAAVASSDMAFAALARRAKLLVKRWRDLVIPQNNSSNSDSLASLPPAAPAPHAFTMVEKGAMQGVPGPPVSPALRLITPSRPSPVAMLSQPTTYDSDSQDVILVDDEPQVLHTSVLGLQGTKRPFPESPPPMLVTPQIVPIDKKPKRDKKNKNRSKNRSKASSPGGITIPAPVPTPPPPIIHNGLSPVPYVHRDIVDLDLEQSRDASLTEAPDVVTVVDEPASIVPPSPVVIMPPVPPTVAKRPGRKNGCRKNASVNFDNYSNFVRDKLPAVGMKKVKTTKELLEDIQSRAGLAIPALLPDLKPSPISKSDIDTATVAIIELNDGDSDDDVTPVPMKQEILSSKKNIEEAKSKSPTPPPAPVQRLLESPRTILSRLPPIVPFDEDDSVPECQCNSEDEVRPDCPAGRSVQHYGSSPSAVFCLHNAYVPDVNGSRDHLEAKESLWNNHPRTVYDSDRGVFFNVVPRYKYLDYSEDKCVKNLSKVPLDRYSPAPALTPEETEPFFRRHYDSSADTPFSEDEATRKLCNGGPLVDCDTSNHGDATERVVSNKLDIQDKSYNPEPLDECIDNKPIVKDLTLLRPKCKAQPRNFKYGDNVLTLPLSIAELNSLHEPEVIGRVGDLSSVFADTAVRDPELTYDYVVPPSVIEYGDISKRSVNMLQSEPVPEPQTPVVLPAFKEWHDPVSRISGGEESLCILPYVVID